MASITKLLTENSNDKNEIKSQVELNGQPFKTFKFKTESMPIKHQATLITQLDFSGDTTLVWGNDTYGIWNSFYWGNAHTSSETMIIRVVPPNNLFEEEFVSDFFVDTTSSTATRTVNVGVTF